MSCFSRNVRILSCGGDFLELFVQQFVDSLQDLSLDIYQCCGNNIVSWFHGYRLARLCQNFVLLRSLNFAINVQFFEKFDKNQMNLILNSFRTLFWLNGPCGSIKVSVDIDRISNVLHMVSLPYEFNEHGLSRTIEIMDMKFNFIRENEEKISSDLCFLLNDFWRNVPWLKIRLSKKPFLSLAFLQCLQIKSRG